MNVKIIQAMFLVFGVINIVYAASNIENEDQLRRYYENKNNWGKEGDADDDLSGELLQKAVDVNNLAMLRMIFAPPKIKVNMFKSVENEARPRNRAIASAFMKAIDEEKNDIINLILDKVTDENILNIVGYVIDSMEDSEENVDRTMAYLKILSGAREDLARAISSMQFKTYLFVLIVNKYRVNMLNKLLEEQRGTVWFANKGHLRAAFQITEKFDYNKAEGSPGERINKVLTSISKSRLRD